MKDDFKYLGSWVDGAEKDISVRKPLAWRALNSMSSIWKSRMRSDLKRRFFVATVESILLYGCESWALNEAMERSLDGTYTRMLQKVLNTNWRDQISNSELYGGLPRLSSKIASRRMRVAGHCYRHPELSTQKLVLWEPTRGRRGRGRPKTTYIDTLKRDTGAKTKEELATLMSDRGVWRNHVKSRLMAT